MPTEERVGIGWDPLPDRVRRGPSGEPGKWTKYIDIAKDAAARETRKERIGGRSVEVGPWIWWPDDKEPLVREGVPRELRAKFGAGTPYHSRERHYFEIELRDTVPVPSSTGKSTSTKGVLYVRQIFKGVTA